MITKPVVSLGQLIKIGYMIIGMVLAHFRLSLCGNTTLGVRSNRKFWGNRWSWSFHPLEVLRRWRLPSWLVSFGSWCLSHWCQDRDPVWHPSQCHYQYIPIVMIRGLQRPSRNKQVSSEKISPSTRVLWCGSAFKNTGLLQVHVTELAE